MITPSGGFASLTQTLTPPSVDARHDASVPPLPAQAAAHTAATRQWWYVAPARFTPVGTAVEGPWTMTRLQSAIHHGTIESTRLVWSPGMGGWEPAGYQAEFAFDFSPPPLPTR